VSERPCVSVVVPFFESARHIAACVESLLAQRDVVGPYEVLMVDNGSPDDSAEIVGRYPEVTLLTEPKRGAYAARNAALRVARAPVIAFTDADCIAHPDWLRSILEGLEEPGTAVLLGHCSYPRDSSSVLNLLGAWENAKADYVIERCQPENRIAYANNMAVRAALFEELGPFEEWPRAADSEWVHRLARRRPDLRMRFHDGMRITHLEFVRGGRRLERLRLYRHTNSRIEGFRELSIGQRLGVLLHLFRRYRAKEPNEVDATC
jgi:glycosyltransferase involved in cell wall biosynthesis